MASPSQSETPSLEVRSLDISGQQYFVAARSTSEGGIDVSLTDGQSAWRGSVCMAELSHPQCMDAPSFASRLLDGLLERGPVSGDRIDLRQTHPGECELAWHASLRQNDALGLTIGLGQARV